MRNKRGNLFFQEFSYIWNEPIFLDSSFKIFFLFFPIFLYFVCFFFLTYFENEIFHKIPAAAVLRLAAGRPQLRCGCGQKFQPQLGVRSKHQNCNESYAEKSAVNWRPRRCAWSAQILPQIHKFVYGFPNWSLDKISRNSQRFDSGGFPVIKRILSFFVFFSCAIVFCFQEGLATLLFWQDKRIILSSTDVTTFKNSLFFLLIVTFLLLFFIFSSVFVFFFCFHFRIW